MFRITRLGQKLGIVLMAALILFAVITARGIYDEISEVKEINEVYLRDARQALFSADFEAAIVRAAGEAAAFALTRRSAYLQEATDATNAARHALNKLRLTLGDSPTTLGLEGKHVGFLERQHQLLTLVDHGIAVAFSLPSRADKKQVGDALEAIYAYESAVVTLHRDVGEHREAELSANEHQFRELSSTTLTNFATSFLSLLGLIAVSFYLLRDWVVRPINRLAAAANAVTLGGLGETVPVTSGDEVGRLQTAFNKMAQTLVDRQKEIEDSDIRFREIAEHFPGAFIISGAAREILYVSPGYEQVWGSTREVLLANPASLVAAIHPDDRERVLSEWKHLDRGESSAQEFRILDFDGTVRWIWDRGVPVKDEHGHLVRVIAISEDITHRKSMQADLQLKETLYQTLVNTTGTGYFMIDQAGRLLDANEEYVRLSGRRSVGEIQWKPVSQWIAPHDCDRGADAIEHCLRRGTINNLEIDFVNRAGVVTPVEISAAVIQTNLGPRILGLCSDISERKRTERALRDSREQSRRFAARLISSIERERARIAREMHDELGQTFTGLSLDLAWLKLELGELPQHGRTEALGEKVRSMVGATDDAITVVRRIANNLRPPIWDNTAIVPALSAQIEQFQERTGIRCVAELDDTITLDPDRGTQVYRVFQEALTNIARHAGASQVNIGFTRTAANRLRLEVSDNGVGVEPAVASHLGSLGIIGMYERAHLLDGELTLKPNPVGGTIIQLEFPIISNVLELAARPK